MKRGNDRDATAPHGRGRRLFRLTGCAAVAIIAGGALYIGLIRAGVIRDPLWPTAHGDVSAARSERPGLRVLFVGNSLTYVNSMPALVERLADAGGIRPPVIAVWYTAGGWTLREAADDAGLARLIREVPWSYVVLQEQSQIGSFSLEGSREAMFPAAGSLAAQITRAGARPMLFAPWAWRGGDGWNAAADSYDGMQQRIFAAYGELGTELSAPVAPVGLAWQMAREGDPGIELWASDGVHTSLAGSYLAACVFYVMLTGRDPQGDPFTAGLASGQARYLQQAAWIAAAPVTPAR